MKEQLHRVLVPVLLGSSAQTLKIARRLHRRYGVISHLYCPHPRLAAHICTCLRVVRIPTFLQGALLCGDLCAFAAEYPDLLFCLIPCTENYEHFCAAHQAELESYYLIIHPEQLQNAALPYLHKEEVPV